MDKSPEAFRTISEVADALDVPPHVLRFWETNFTQVKPVKRGGGRRYYRPEDVRLLRGIRGLLHDDGMTIKGVQKILRESGLRHVIGLGTLPAEVEPAPEPEVVAPPSAAPEAPRAPARPPGRSATSSTPGPRSRRWSGPWKRRQSGRGRGPAARRRRLDKAALRGLLAELQALRAVISRSRGASRAAAFRTQEFRLTFRYERVNLLAVNPSSMTARTPAGRETDRARPSPFCLPSQAAGDKAPAVGL